MTEWLSQKEIASRLGLSTRQIRNLEAEGLPKRSKSGKISYEWGAVHQWNLDRKIREAVEANQPAEPDDAQARLNTAKARLAELDLAERERQLVTMDYAEKQLSAICSQLRASLLAIPAKYAPLMVGRQSIPEAQLKLEEMVGEVMAALSEVGADEDLDADDDGPSEAPLAA